LALGTAALTNVSIEKVARADLRRLLTDMLVADFKAHPTVPTGDANDRVTSLRGFEPVLPK
jgi:hypothetical protein